MDKEIKIWAAKLIEAHRQPIVKIPISGPKYFSTLDGYQDKLHSKLSIIKDMVSETRVETRCGRSMGLWLPEQQHVKITSQCGRKMNSMGFQEPSGKFLYPFEAMFLLETNRLEIIDADIPWTIHKAYNTLLRDGYDLELYKTFRKLMTLGYELKWRDIVEQESKKMKYCPPCQTNNLSESATYGKLFQALKSVGPKSYENSSNEDEPGWMFRISLDAGWHNLQTLIGDSFEIQSKFGKGISSVFSPPQCDSALIEIQLVHTPDLPTRCTK